jgi:hypothetical protein
MRMRAVALWVGNETTSKSQSAVLAGASEEDM